MSNETVQANYGDIGARLIERMYSGDYLSIGGTASTDLLAGLAGVARDSRVLDVGSGLGGPAIRLAKRYGCRVTGLDLVESNVAAACERAGARKLDGLVDFRVGDAMALPFADAAFDIVWGQDAWCHVPDKARLIAECARVLAPGGRLAFTDWVETGPMDAACLARVTAATASENLATPAHYRRLLAAQGLQVVHDGDIGANFIGQYREVIARLEAMEAELTADYSGKLYRIVLEKNAVILQAFEARKLGGCRFVATKPPAAGEIS